MAWAHERGEDPRPSSRERPLRERPDRARRAARDPAPRRAAQDRRAVVGADARRRDIPADARCTRLQRRRPRHPAGAHDRRRRARAPDRAPARRTARFHRRRGDDAIAREPDQAARREREAARSADRGARLVVPVGSCRLRGRDRRSCSFCSSPRRVGLAASGGSWLPSRTAGMAWSRTYLRGALALGRTRWSHARYRRRPAQCRGRPDPLDAAARTARSAARATATISARASSIEA